MEKSENTEKDNFLETLQNNFTFSTSNINKISEANIKQESLDKNFDEDQANNDNDENLFSDLSSQNSLKHSSRSHSRSPVADNKRKRNRGISRSRSPRIKRLKFEDDKEDSANFVMKNGCCRECMRAFSKSGKSCLCQVPKYERKYTLADNGCNFCGCNGKFFFKNTRIVLT